MDVRVNSTPVRVVRAPRPEGSLALALGLAALPHLVPFIGMAALDWDIFETTLAYWGGLVGLLVICVVRAWRSKVGGRVGALFFIGHGGGFLVGCLLLTVVVVGGHGTLDCVQSDGSKSCEVTSLDMPWVQVLTIGGAAALSLLIPETLRARLAPDAPAPSFAGTVVRFYFRMILLFVVAIVAAGSLHGATAGWIVILVAAGVDLVAAVVTTLWPWRFAKKDAAVAMAPPEKPPAS